MYLSITITLTHPEDDLEGGSGVKTIFSKGRICVSKDTAMILFALGLGYPPKLGSGGEDRHKTVSLEHWITR